MKYPYSIVIKYNESPARLNWMAQFCPDEGLDRWCWTDSPEFGEGYEIFFRDEADYMLYLLKWA